MKKHASHDIRAFRATRLWGVFLCGRVPVGWFYRIPGDKRDCILQYGFPPEAKGAAITRAIWPLRWVRMKIRDLPGFMRKHGLKFSHQLRKDQP